MTEYRLNVPDETWDDWKATVPRDQTLSNRIEQLIKADLAADCDVLSDTPSPRAGDDA